MSHERLSCGAWWWLQGVSVWGMRVVLPSVCAFHSWRPSNTTCMPLWVCVVLCRGVSCGGAGRREKVTAEMKRTARKMVSGGAEACHHDCAAAGRLTRMLVCSAMRAACCIPTDSSHAPCLAASPCHSVRRSARKRRPPTAGTGRRFSRCAVLCCCCGWQVPGWSARGAAAPAAAGAQRALPTPAPARRTTCVRASTSDNAPTGRR
jgi:hypothetical protein